MNRDEGQFHLSHLYDDLHGAAEHTKGGGGGAFHLRVTGHHTIA